MMGNGFLAIGEEADLGGQIGEEADAYGIGAVAGDGGVFRQW